MIVKTSLDKGAPEIRFPWMNDAIFGITCALIVAVFAWSAEPAFRTLATPSPKDSFYNLLVQGLQNGQFNLKKPVPPELARLTDPYNPAVSTPYIAEVCDMSYYKGKLYLYFGIVPALVLLWPFAALTGDYLSDKDAVVFFFTVGVLIGAGILRAIWRHYFPKASIWTLAACVLAFGAVTSAIELDSLWCDVYEVAATCGFTFSMLAVGAIWKSLHEPKRRALWLFLASLAYGLAIGSRASLLFGMIILLIPIVRAWCEPPQPGSRNRTWLLLVAAIAPITTIGLGLMLYNELRFDNPFEFGVHYQLEGIYDPRTTPQFGLHFFWYNFLFYFSEPVRWGGHFPFLQAVPLPSAPPGYIGTGNNYGGILLTSVVAWATLALPLLWTAKLKSATANLRWFVFTAFVLFTICALTTTLYFSASPRYELDFVPALMLLGLTGIFCLERRENLPMAWRMAHWGWPILLGGTILLNLLASIEAQSEGDYFKGNASLSNGRIDAAIIQYEKALTLWPNSADANAGLGSAFLQKGQIDQAIVQYQKALEFKPGVAETCNNLGDCFLQKNQGDEAIVQYQRAIEGRPNFPEAMPTSDFVCLEKGGWMRRLFNIIKP
jgi:hypothetical protein